MSTGASCARSWIDARFGFPSCLRYQPVERIIAASGRRFCPIPYPLDDEGSLKLEEEAPRLRFSSLISTRITRPRLEGQRFESIFGQAATRGVFELPAWGTPASPAQGAEGCKARLTVRAPDSLHLSGRGSGRGDRAPTDIDRHPGVRVVKLSLLASLTRGSRSPSTIAV